MTPTTYYTNPQPEASSSAALDPAARRPSNPWTTNIPLKLVNIAVYGLCLANHIYQIGVGEEMHPIGRATYITPAEWIYNIWTVIHFLLAGTMVFQFFPAGKASVIDGIGWWFPYLGILNFIFVYVWALGHYVWAFLLSLFLSWIVTIVWENGRPNDRPIPSVGEELLVNLPFGLYSGWMKVIRILSLFDAFGISETEIPGGWTKFFVFVALLMFYFAGTSHGNSKREVDWTTLEVNEVVHFSGDQLYHIIPSFACLWAIAERQQSNDFIHTCYIFAAYLYTVLTALTLFFILVTGLALLVTYTRMAMNDLEKGRNGVVEQAKKKAAAQGLAGSDERRHLLG